MRINQIVRPLATTVIAIAALVDLATSASLANTTPVSDDAAAGSSDTQSIAIFAGGCFWCVESDFDSVPGVTKTISGYAGGNTLNPTYKNHHAGMHREVVEITYDSSIVSYDQLLHTFWRSVDPTDDGGQFCDRGHSYTTAIYPVDQAQREAAVKSKQVLEQSGTLKDAVVTPVEATVEFWPAEDYHQNYYKVNPIRYKYYRNACGRDKQVKKVWGGEAHAGIEGH